MEYAIDFRSVVARVGRFPALAGVDLQVTPGSVVALIGHNGAGKTSLLRTCAGLMEVVEGHAHLFGIDLRDDPSALRRTVGLLGHDLALYEELNPFENLSFAVRASGADMKRAKNALERVGVIGRIADTPVARLSAGQRRRSALAVLIARQPKLWLLDEPHSSLDVQGRKLLNEIFDEATNAGATILFSSHEPDVANALSDDVVTMNGGTISTHAKGKRQGSKDMRDVNVA
jgi:heme ABC exporter ATP-binding subunit CcmA